MTSLAVQERPAGSRTYDLSIPSRLTSLVARSILLLGALCLLAACGDESTPTPTSVAQAAQQAIVNGQTPAPDGESAPNPALPTPTPRPTPTPVVGQISLWHSWSQADGDALTAILDTFRRQHPQVDIDAQFVPYDDLAHRYTEAAQAGGGPDLLLAPHWWLRDLASSAVVQPLDMFIPTDSTEAFWPAALDALRWNDQLYALPTHLETVGLFYNRALIAEDRLPATTGDLLALAQERPEQGIGLYATLYHLFWGIPAYGGDLLNEQDEAVLNQTNGAAEFLSWLVDLNRASGTFVDSDYGMLMDRFKKGEFAFFVDGPWALDELRGALGESLAVTTLPSGTVGRAQPWLSADGLFLNPNTAAERADLARLLIGHITNGESGDTLARIARRVPATRFSQLADEPLLRGFAQQAADARPLPTVPEMEEVWYYSGEMLEKVLNGVSAPQTAVAEASALINDANGK